MRIVVVGAGKLGYSIAELLSKEQFEVVVIDEDEAQLEAVKNTLDVLTIAANGASPVTMADPDVMGADILIAVTASDEVNMVACILAKKHKITHTVARIRDMQFVSEGREYLKENFDIDLILNPEQITANEINRILMTPAALDVEDFASGKIRLFETKVPRKSKFANVKFKDIKLPPGVLAGMIFRDHRMIIPHGDDCLLPHDNAYFIGIPEEIEKFSLNFVQRNARKLHRVMIIGAGRTGRLLAETLDKQGVEVKVIDQNRERCRMVAARLNKGMAICGDGTDLDLLTEEGVQDADVAIVSMASHLEDSVETILNLKELGVGHIIAKANSDRIRYVLERIGADQVIQPENEMGQRVAISIMNPKISDIFQMADDYAIMEIKAPELWINHEIKQLNLRELYGVNVIGIRKNKERKVNINFKGDTVIQADDFLVIAADATKIASLNLD